MDAGVIERYRTLAGKVLLALDGVTYFSSSTLHCPQCSQRTQAGHTVYSHTALTPVLVQPGQSKVVALPPNSSHHKTAATNKTANSTWPSVGYSATGCAGRGGAGR